MDMIKNLETLLASGTDNALLRYGLGNAYFGNGDIEPALEHLAKALEHDPSYSAAWKLYAKALTQAGRSEEAVSAYHAGIEAAEANGDIQAAKEMRVFLKRLEKEK